MNKCECFFLHLLSILEGNHSHLMYDKGVLGCNAKGLTKKMLRQLWVISESILQTDVQHWQVTSAKTRMLIFQAYLSFKNIPKAILEVLGLIQWKVYKPFHELGRCEVRSHGLVMFTLYRERVAVCNPRRAVRALQSGGFTVKGDFHISHKLSQFQIYRLPYKVFSQIYHKNVSGKWQ